jgi:2-amino-4-hydroxy-6-hydroxymethyldihydropteridine diphosphokinase/dihydropteroate synthase
LYLFSRDWLARPPPLLFQNLTQHRYQPSTNNDTLNYTTTSMKAFQLGRCVGGRTLISRNVSILRTPNSSAVSFVQKTSVRHQSSSEELPKVPQWTQHSFNELTPPPVENDVLSKASQKTPTLRTAYVALGSNLGDRMGWIEKACKEMSQHRGIKIKRTSCLWETEPMYVTDQGSFINGVCEVSPRIFSDSSGSSA